MILEGFKRCSKCGEIKAFDEFGKKKRGKYGLRTICKSCKKAESKSYREANKEKSKVYYEANKEKIKAQSKAYYEANTEKCKTRIKAYSEANPEKSQARHRAWHEANREKNKTRYRAWYEDNREIQNGKAKIRNRENVENMRGTYILKLLSQQFKIPKSELKPLLTPEIIEIKKNQLKYLRIIKNNDYGKKEALTNA